MSSLPTWTSWVIVVACPLLGAIAFLVVLPVTVLDRRITGVFSSPCETINSASCGAKNRFSRPTRPNSSTCSAYNLKRMITIFGMGPLMAAIRT
jgi:hypothetical protein